MNQFGWAHCPASIRDQINRVVELFHCTLASHLVGVYLHGSLALDCFNPQRSDIDLLVVAQESLALETKRSVAEHLLRHNNQPRPIELSIVTWGQIHPWTYPTPYDFHFGDSVASDLATGSWRAWNDAPHTDPDLAAHLTILHRCGICLSGKPISETFPEVPREHYRASLLLDFDYGRERLNARPDCFVLNACRIAAFIRDGQILSKEEGGRWGLSELPVGVHAVVWQALRLYRGETADARFSATALTAFIRHLLPIVAG